jgi:hypothetical protein
LYAGSPGLFFNEFLITVRFRSPETMIDVADDNFDSKLRLQLSENIEHHDRVNPAADRGNDRIAALQEFLGVNEFLAFPKERSCDLFSHSCF